METQQTDQQTEEKLTEHDSVAYKKEMMERASKIKTADELAAFVKEISAFNHDYNTIVAGCMAAMKAAFCVVNASPNGGITGFQAGCLGWECVREFMYINGPARLLDFDHLLFPTYESYFDKTINTETWQWLREKAKKNLEEKTPEGHPQPHPDVVSHWKSVVAGNLPFGFTIKDD